MKYQNKYLLINNGKLIIEPFNNNAMPNFNSYNISYISMLIKRTKLITDLDMVNQNLIESHIIWEKLKKNNIRTLLLSNYYIARISKLHEYIIYDLKHFIDEIITTIAIVKGYIKKDKVLVSSIGDYLNKKLKDFTEFDEFSIFFNQMNDLVNAYKHSYTNSNSLIIMGRDEECFVALYSKHNDFNNLPLLYVISVNYIVQEFNKFYKYSMELIDKLTKNESIVKNDKI